jgi:hypothetical protein
MTDVLSSSKGLDLYSLGTWFGSRPRQSLQEMSGLYLNCTITASFPLLLIYHSRIIRCYEEERTAVMKKIKVLREKPEQRIV